MEIKEKVLLGQFSTFGIGGPAKYFCEAANAEEIEQALVWGKKHGQSVFVLGGGSNVLFNDEGFNGLVLKIEHSRLAVEPQSGLWSNPRERWIRCGAGVDLQDLVRFTAEHHLTGLEWAAGIPGTVGGAVRGNAGAFGGEMKASILSVGVLGMHPPYARRTIEAERCEFEYRTSLFKKKRNWVVEEALFQLNLGDPPQIQKKIDDILRHRRNRHPDLKQFPSAGSVFKNPVAYRELIEAFEQDKAVVCSGVKVPAGWLIDRCGLMGTRIGGAMVSDKQANFIVNLGNATAGDVIALIRVIKQQVHHRFRVHLEEEIEIVPDHFVVH